MTTATGEFNIPQLPTAPSTSSCQTTPNRRSSRQASRSLVYVTRRIPQKGMDILLNAFDVKQWDAEQAVPRGELLHSIVGVEGILCMQSDLIDANVLNVAGPNLRVIATMAATGSQHIDMEECYKRGIQVITCPNQPTETLAELSVALVLLTLKESQTDEEKQISNVMMPPDILSDDLTNSKINNRPRLMRRQSEEQMTFQWTNGKPGNTNSSNWKNIVKKSFGVYGMTSLGLSVAKLLKNIGVGHVMIADKDAELDNSDLEAPNTDSEIVPFDDLLEKSDVILVCGSAGEESNSIFCKETFKKMKSDAILVTSQSEEQAIDYVDLYAALRDGQIKAAGLNDCNQEPVPFKTPLLGLRNCVFLPQTQESVYDIRHKISVLIARNLTDALRGK